jgi:N-acetylmuramoyl-L-alanine amidase
MLGTVLASWVLATLPSWDADETRALLHRLAADGPRAPGGGPLFPPDTVVEGLTWTGAGLEVLAAGSWGPGDDEVVEELRRETLLGGLLAAGIVAPVILRVQGPDGAFRLLGHRQRAPASPAPGPRGAPWERPGKTDRLPFGAPLAGVRVALSAGHGWVVSGSGWATQRSRWDFDGCANCRGIVEDFFNAQLVARHLVTVLENMGARVILVREPDLSTAPPALVDDGEEGYAEQGPWAAGQNDGGHGGDYRANPAADPGMATWSFTLAEEGPRRVAIRYVEGGNRTTRATVTVEDGDNLHPQGLDQRQPARSWMDLGLFHFLAGTRRVTLSHGVMDGYLIADAVKVGGGVFTLSGKPSWEMAAKSYVGWAGAPGDVTSRGDVTIRPAYAELFSPDVFVSIHGNASGNAGGTTTHGTSTYRYSCLEETGLYGDHSLSDSAVTCDDPPGSRALLDAVHGALVARLRRDWDGAWGDMGKRVADFGELRVLDRTPGVLVETAFFDNIARPAAGSGRRMSDNRAMHDPRWREVVAQGIAEGIAAYVAPGSGAPPPRPEGLRALNQQDGTLRVAWRPVPGALGYRLYTARHGRVFDAGRLVEGTQVVLDDLEPRQTYAWRVSALDTSGEGLPSQAVVARFRGAWLSAGPAAHGLVVMAYDRRDAWVQEGDNDLCLAVEHGHALAAAGPGELFLDGALDEVVEDGTVPLRGYALVDYVAGKDSSADVAVSPGMRARLRAHGEGGGALLLSGEEVGFQLVEVSTDPADRAFVTEVLGATYLADDAEAFAVTGTPGGPLEGLGTVNLDDGSGGVYEVVYPDVLAPAGGSVAALSYPDGTAAAVARPGVVFMGVPLEAVVPGEARADLASRVVAFLLPGLAAGDLDGDGAGDACELAHGLDPRDARDGDADLDGDGRTNAEECQEGTDPTSRPDAGAVPVDGGVGVRDAAWADGAVGARDAAWADGAGPADGRMVPDGGDMQGGDAGPGDAGAQGDDADPTTLAQEGAASPGCGCREVAGPVPGWCMGLVWGTAAWRRRKGMARP